MDVTAFAMASLAALAAAIPATVRVHLGGEHYSRINQWLALVGDPSVGKSPVIDAAVAPLRKLDDDAAKTHESALAQWEGAKSAAAALKVPVPSKPAEPIAYVTDSMTPEAVTETLAAQDRGLLQVCDEVAGWIGAMERTGKNGLHPDRAFWLRGYNGGPYSTRRIVRGRTRVNNLCVSVIGGIQPDVLKRVSEHLMDDGLLQRFVPIIMKTKEIGSGAPYRSEASAYDDLLTRATKLQENLVIGLSDEAKRVFGELRLHKHNLEVDDTLPKGFRGFSGKLDKVFASLCAALLVGDHNGVLPSPKPFIDGATARRAAEIIRNFIIPHAYEVFGLTKNGAANIDGVRAVASFILTDTRERSRYTASDLTTGVRSLRDFSRSQVFEAVAPLVAGGWLELDNPMLRKEQVAYLFDPAIRSFIPGAFEQGACSQEAASGTHQARRKADNLERLPGRLGVGHGVSV